MSANGGGVARRKAGALALPALALALTGALASAAAGRPAARAQGAAEQARPNVILVETDDQTADSLRFMASVRRLLAARGVTFTSSFASFPLCCPSRATALTGQYAHNHGVLGNRPPHGGYEKLDHSSTLAVWLQRAGYHTAHIGKYLNGYGSRGTERQVPPGWSEWHGATRLPFLGFTLNEGGNLVTYPATPEHYQTDVFARKAVDLVGRRAPSSQPFFLWLAFYAPHSGGPRDPDDPPAERRRRGRRQRGGAFLGPSPAPRHRDAFASQPLAAPPSFNEADVSDKPALVRDRPPLAADQAAWIREAYQQRLESLLAVDEAVAALVQALAAAGELDDTLILFTSDNGFFHGEHRVPLGKNLVYEPSIRVPLVVRGPGVPEGRRVTDLVANVDLVPTILAAARAKPGRAIDGRSLFPLMRDRLADFGRDILLETPAWSAIRTHRFVYVEHRTGERELYDLAADPHQLASRHVDPALARVRSELARRLLRLRGCRGAACVRGPRLAVRLGYRSGRGRCARGLVRATVAGGDRAWITAATFFVNGRPAFADRRPPYRIALSRRVAARRPVTTVHARVVTADGRRLTLGRSFRACR